MSARKKSVAYRSSLREGVSTAPVPGFAVNEELVRRVLSEGSL